MIKSMTGFGRSEYNDGKRNITVEIKAVNHRYSDVSVKMPRRYGFAEDKVKAAVKGKLRRGKIDVSIMVENITENDINIKLNQPIAQQYIENLKIHSGCFGLEGGISLQLLATMPDDHEGYCGCGRRRRNNRGHSHTCEAGCAEPGDYEKRRGGKVSRRFAGKRGDHKANPG